MLNFFELLSLLLMISNVSNPSTSQTRQSQDTNPNTVLAVPRFVTSVSLPKLFSDWEVTGPLNTPNYILPPLSIAIVGGPVGVRFPALIEFISRTETEPLLPTWEEHFKRMAHLLSSLNSICQSTKFFRRQWSNEIESDCSFSISDLKVIARVLFDYDFEVPFFSLNCSSSRKHCPNHPCLFISNINNCAFPLESYLVSSLRRRLNAFKLNFLLDPSLSQQTIFFYCETPCCYVVHWVTTLVIIRTGESYNAHYFDSFNRLFNFSYLSDFVKEIFNTNLIVRSCYQQVFDTKDNLSGILSLANARSVFSDRLSVPNSPDFFHKPVPTTSFSFFKIQLKSFIIGRTIELIRQKLIFNLKAFSHLFSQEREKSLTVYKEKQGSFTRSDFLIFLKFVNQEQGRFQKLFDLLNCSNLPFGSSKEAIENCLSLGYGIQTELGKDFLPFDSNSLESFLYQIVDLKSKLFWLNNVIGGRDSTLNYPSWPSSSQHIFDSIDDTALFNLERLRNISQRKKQREKPSSFYIIWEQDFPLIERFLKFDFWVSSFSQENLLPNLKHLADFSIIIRNIMMNWEQPFFLFSKGLSPYRMLSAGEGIIITKLICNFSNDQIFTQDLGSDCFIIAVCSRSGPTDNDGTYCGNCHSRNPSVFKATNCLLVGSSCFDDSVQMESAFSSKVTNRLIVYRNAIDNNPQETRPLVIIGYCCSICCQAIHKTWTLVVSPLTREAFYFDPSGRRQLTNFLATSIQQYFPGMTLNSFENNSPQQPHGSLDFSGVLAICGTREIISYLSLDSDYSISFLEHLLSTTFSVTDEYSRSIDYQVQSSFKNRLVVTAFRRLFSRFFSEASIFTKWFNSLRRKSYDQKIKNGIAEFNWLSEFIEQAEPLYRQIFSFDDDSVCEIIQNNTDLRFEKLMNSTLEFLHSRPKRIYFNWNI